MTLRPAFWHGCASCLSGHLLNCGTAVGNLAAHRASGYRFHMPSASRLILLTLILLAGLPPAALAQGSAHDIPPVPGEIEKAFEAAKGPKLTGRLAFTASIFGYERIFVLDLETRKVEPLVNGPGRNSYPTWSPDGSKLAFTSDRDGNKEIYVADWLGDKQQRMTDFPGADDDASWSPDGKKIIFFRDEGNRTNIFAVSISNRSLQRLTNFSGRNVTPRWSPDGDKIAYSTNRLWPGWDVCLWNLKHKIETCPLQGKASFCRPYWSKKGDELLFSFGQGNDVNVGSMNAKNGDWQRLINLKGKDYDAVFSPDEKFIAFAAEDGGSLFNIMLFNLETRTTAPLLKSRYSLRYLSWGPKNLMALEAQRARGVQ